jgi:hypothetical protein
VAMGSEGIHLYQFSLRAARYGSPELSASSPDVTLAALRLRNGARVRYEYDLNVPWRHEVRLEGPADTGGGHDLSHLRRRRRHPAWRASRSVTTIRGDRHRSSCPTA